VRPLRLDLPRTNGEHAPAFGRTGLGPDLRRAALFALAYFAGSELGYSLSLGPSVGGTFWPPAGISLAVFLLAPYRAWPLLLLAGASANFVSDVLHGQVLEASIGFTAANVGEPILGAFLIRRALPGAFTLTRLQELVVLAVVVVFASAPLAAAFGAFIAERFTPDPPGFASGWRTWWIGDMVGALVLAPFSLRLITDWQRRGTIRPGTWLEGAAFALVLWLITHIVFAAPPTSLAMPFLVFPVLLWGSVRLGVIGVGAALCLVVTLTAHDTAAGMGPFAAAHLSLGDRLIALQLYVGVMAISFHGLAVLWEERMRTAAALEVAHSGLEAQARRQLMDANAALRDREEALSYALREMAVAQAHREHLLEAERSARGEAERASQLKDEFLATLSHELRTPLNAILGWAQILQTTSKDPAVARAIETIARNARVQATLIEDLLDMSRIVSGKVELTRAPARLADIVTAAADALRPVARAREVTLSVSAADGAEGITLTCDAPRLQQVVSNLLDNGIKFTLPGGRVDVQVSADRSEARVVVRDTGQGIAADFLPAVFERFRQADGSTTRRHGGLGLGLSIAKQIVEMHGGSIRAESDGAGRGSVFTVALPLADAAAPMVAPDGLPVPTSSSLRGLRVLVVDDDQDARELLRRLLADQGCEVVCASSAERALQALEGEQVDVILTDIGMPDTDGYELLRLVRSGRLAAIKAIAVTAFARPEDRERALTAGFDAHLSKPVDPALLLRTVMSVAAPGSSAVDRDQSNSSVQKDFRFL
jgi:signal transduction histidine kinase/FixJ family two-component response regulator